MFVDFDHKIGTEQKLNDILLHPIKEEEFID